MERKPFGCLTPFGLLAGLLTLLIIGGVSAAQGGAMFSPGELSSASGPELGGFSSHQAVSGQCSTCHTAPWDPDSMTLRCLDCHTRQKDELADPSTLHGSLVENPALVDCLDCHTEHHGPQAGLTHMDIASFPHDPTGYSLLAHQVHADGLPFTCEDCHSSGLSVFELPVCMECHEQLDASYMRQHFTAFGASCLDCHDGMDRFGSAFDHDQTSFSLVGQHARTACEGCHQGNTTSQDLKNTPNECAGCHEADDVHNGQLGNDCSVCHNTVNWSDVQFDHTSTHFPLTGEHASLGCSKCHTGERFKGTPTECSACHADPDYHAGLVGSDCADCHNTAAWLPARYDRPHSFPQKHGDASSCRDCHPASLGGWTCYTCHDQQEVLAEHSEEGISDFANCMECHPDGEEGNGDDGDEHDDDD